MTVSVNWAHDLSRSFLAAVWTDPGDDGNLSCLTTVWVCTRKYFFPRNLGVKIPCVTPR